jgi:hypothetical protein
LFVSLLKCLDGCTPTPPYPTLTCLTYPLCAKFHLPYTTLMAGPRNLRSIPSTDISKVGCEFLPTSCAANTGAVPREVKRTRREAGHATPSNAESDECVELHLHSPIYLYLVVLC